MFFITCVCGCLPMRYAMWWLQCRKRGSQVRMSITRKFRLAILVIVAGVVVLGSEGCRARKDCGCDINGLYKPLKRKHRY